MKPVRAAVPPDAVDCCDILRSPLCHTCQAVVFFCAAVLVISAPAWAWLAWAGSRAPLGGGTRCSTHLRASTATGGCRGSGGRALIALHGPLHARCTLYPDRRRSRSRGPQLSLSLHSGLCAGYTVRLTALSGLGPLHLIDRRESRVSASRAISARAGGLIWGDNERCAAHGCVAK